MRVEEMFEFFLNDFLWIQWIQWIMTKSKGSMVTRNIIHLTIVIFLDVEVKKNFLLLPVDWYMLQVVTGNRYLPRGSNENAPFITNTGNVSVSRWVIPLVTIPLLDSVMSHWIHRIQWNLFRENSIATGILPSVLKTLIFHSLQKVHCIRVTLSPWRGVSCKIFCGRTTVHQPQLMGDPALSV